MAAADVAPATVVLRTIAVPEATVFRAEPAVYAAVIDSLSARSLPVYGRFGTSLLVQVDSLFGWIAER